MKKREWWLYTNSLGNQFIFDEKQDDRRLHGETCLVMKDEPIENENGHMKDCGCNDCYSRQRVTEREGGRE